MNLKALYELMASRADANGTIDLPTWTDIAAAAQVDILDDARALGALIQKGAVDRQPLPNTFGDYRYVLRTPAEGLGAPFYAALATIGSTVRPLRA